jgi:hypothetical protein
MRLLWLAAFMLPPFLSACAGTRELQNPTRSEAEVVRIANKAVVDAGIPLSPEQASATRASYEPSNGLWCISYQLYTHELPAGPIVCVGDRSGHATFQPAM